MAQKSKNSCHEAILRTPPSEQIREEMRALKKGKLKSGRSKKPVKSRKQAIAIGLSKARKKGIKVPKPKK